LESHYRYIRVALFFCLLFGLNQAFAQKYPQDYFRYPMDSLPNYVSPFGVMRENHFHSGIDLRTNGKIGLPVYAAADGYINRIKVARGAYGKALYIEHANGYSTVYAHLDSYYGAIAQWIHDYQYINQTFEFDKIFMKPFLRVKKGDTIGLSGNSGSSSGPHLHFEIRDSRTEKILNPALFGILPIDNFAPEINKIYVYKFVREGLLLKKQLAFTNKTASWQNGFLQLKDTLLLDPDTYGFGIDAVDYIHNNKDPKGLYSYSFWLNQSHKFTHKLNQFAFDETKYINAHIDFPYYKLEKLRVQKCFVDDGNRFSTYQTDAEKGRVNFAQAASSGELIFEAADVNKNKTYVKILYKIGLNQMDAERQAYEKQIANQPMLIPGKANVVEKEGFWANIDEKSLYDTVCYALNILPKTSDAFSQAYHFHSYTTPVHAAFDVAIKLDVAHLAWADKMVLAYAKTPNDGFYSIGGTYKKGWVQTKASNFGLFKIMLDTVAPQVKWLLPKKGKEAADTLRWDFEIKDDFSGIKSYDMFLNGRWIIGDFDAKNDRLTYLFDEVYFIERERIYNLENNPAEAKAFRLLVRVVDNKGNKTERWFEMNP